MKGRVSKLAFALRHFLLLATTMMRRRAVFLFVAVLALSSRAYAEEETETPVVADDAGAAAVPEMPDLSKMRIKELQVFFGCNSTLKRLITFLIPL